MPKPTPTPYTTSHPPTLAEQEDVHAVYEAIAPHFSSTRYKPWPLVSSFLESLPPCSIGLDSGAGNGKYVPLASEQGRMCWALDMSWGLLSVARGSLGGGETGTGGHDGQAGPSTSSSASASPSRGPVECLRGELGYDGWRAGVFDWAISIAAIHHLSTPQRRCQAVQALMRSLVHRSSHTDDNQPRSRFMIYVWAYEQGEGSKRKMGKRAAAGRTPDEENDDITERTRAMALEDGPDRSGQGHHNAAQSFPEQQSDGDGDIVQDVLVPWVLQPSRPASTRQPGQPRARKKKRPAAVGQLPGGPSVVDNEGQVIEGQGAANTSVQDEEQASHPPAEEPKVYHRYYHLFLRGELRELVVAAAKADGYDVLPDPGDCAAGEEPSRIGPGSSDGKWMRVLKEGWEADNWWIECEVGKGGL